MKRYPLFVFLLSALGLFFLPIVASALFLLPAAVFADTYSVSPSYGTVATPLTISVDATTCLLGSCTLSFYDPTGLSLGSVSPYADYSAGFGPLLGVPDVPGSYTVFLTNTDQCSGLDESDCSSVADDSTTFFDTVPAATTSTSTIPYAPTEDEFLFIFGLFLFIGSVPFWHGIFSIGRGRYDI